MENENIEKWKLRIRDFLLKYVESDAKILYHYTSVDALFRGIIVKNEPEPGKEICLWATNCRYVNDPEELSVGIQLANKVLDFSFDEPIQKNCEQKGNKKQLKDEAYIVSFSSAIDCLPMWGMYGQKGHGLALGFDTEIIKASFSDLLLKCIYVNQEDNAQLINVQSELDVFKNLWRQDDGSEEYFNIFFFVYMILWICGKHSAYEYEQEVRWFLTSPRPIKYRLKNNLIVPYIELYLPKSALKEIWIGPTNDMNMASRSMRTYLDHMGFHEVEIKQSKVPYRD